MDQEPHEDATGTAVADPAGRLEADIARLVERSGGGDDADLLESMIRTTLSLIGDGTRRGNLKIINSALADMRASFRLFDAYRDRRKVTIFGSARTPPEHPEYAQAHELGRRLTEAGIMTITGGGDGVMLGANAGAGRDQSFGCLIQLPFEPEGNHVLREDEKLLTFKYFFTRKLTFVKETDGVVLLPGGFGTLDECFEVLTLIQTGKTAVQPVIFLDAPGGDYWRSLQRQIEVTLERSGKISPFDRHLFTVTDCVETAVAELTRFYRNYHSMRYIGDVAVLRMQQPATAALLAELDRDFSDILEEGSFEPSAGLDEERTEPELVHLARLVFRFDRRSFGRLRQLIDRLNDGERATPSLG